MKAPFSPYLNQLAPALKDLVRDLRKDFDYVSVLATDCVGLTMSVSQHSQMIRNSNRTTEQGCVVRVCREGLYREYAFNGFDPAAAQSTADLIRRSFAQFDELLSRNQVQAYQTGVLSDEKAEVFVEMEAELLPETADLNSVIALMKAISDAGMKAGKAIIDSVVSMESTHISKMFISEHRYLRQSYVYCEGQLTEIAQRNGRIRSAYREVDGRKGLEILSDLKPFIQPTADWALKMIDSGPIVPGEYTVITVPAISGLIAHEAFGHGVEMDQFVKDRAKGKYFINKRVGSDHVTMHEGALLSPTATGYAFDDEGVLANDVTEIDHGILKTGVCDALAALRLGSAATGNGKRETFEHKAYTRMTNTCFSAGSDTLDEMIRSVDYGYLLDGMEGGMEDPKHWGIQCTVSCGYEIRDGRLTGAMVGPLVMTGYVPDMLGSVSMVGPKVEVDGASYCGKGYKEWVKVGCGGPYLKLKVRLG